MRRRDSNLSLLVLENTIISPARIYFNLKRFTFFGEIHILILYILLTHSNHIDEK